MKNDSINDSVAANLALVSPKNNDINALMAKYNMNGPRYTSYPTALEFKSDFSNEDFCAAVVNSSNDKLSLYIHIPFCHKLCYYCGCNKIVTRHKHKAEVYLDYLEQEMMHRAELFSGHQVVQLHFGGGTPSFLSAQQFSRVMHALKQRFTFAPDAEISIEIDPREIELSLLDHLKELGFTRLSFGVQDTNLVVQEAINRIQDLDFIKQLIKRGKSLGFRSINLDVIYGLPHQTADLFELTLRDIIDCDPDRISLFSYAHLPSRFAAQRKIKDQWLPSAAQKMSLMLRAISVFSRQGYIAIGMDHFAKPKDELAKAQQQGQLHRNFQGYTTLEHTDLLGLGVSSISSVGNSISQNRKDLKAYYQAIDTHHHALEKGVQLSRDDLIRADVIKRLMCNFVLDMSEIETLWQIRFSDYFKDELDKLTTFIKDDMIRIADHKITVSQNAKLFIRRICMTFDKYMAAQLIAPTNNASGQSSDNLKEKQRFSRII